MRESYIAGNWKMHYTPAEAVALAGELKKSLADSATRVLIAPNFTALAQVAREIEGSRIALGAQNMAAEEQGAHTGETSVLMLKALGVAAVILGHSERRAIYKEDDALINAKVRLALSHGLQVILCVGETLEEREAGKLNQVIETQTKGGLLDVTEQDMAKITVAYEPVWAIGTGKTATPEDADQVHKLIRDLLADLYSPATAQAAIIQYGGSVKPENAKDLMAKDNIDGALVGGASLKAASFTAIVNYDK